MKTEKNNLGKKDPNKLLKTSSRAGKGQRMGEQWERENYGYSLSPTVKAHSHLTHRAASAGSKGSSGILPETTFPNPWGSKVAFADKGLDIA